MNGASLGFFKAAVLGACLAAAPAFAGPIGSLVTDGSAFIHVGGNGSALEARGTHTVFAGDRIDTRSHGARLMLRDGSVITLSPSSSMVVRTSTDTVGSVELISGQLRLEAGSQAWSLIEASGQQATVPAGSTVEFGVQSNETEAGNALEEVGIDPAPRPQSIS